MTTLTVTSRGQVTFRKEVLRHLGIKPGEKIELDLLPDGRGVLRAAQSPGTIDDFVGLLAGRTKKVATLEEIDAAAANCQGQPNFPQGGNSNIPTRLRLRFVVE